MSEENVEKVRGLYEMANRHHAAKARDDAAEAKAVFERLAELFDPEFEYREDPRWPGSQTYHGLDEARAIWDEYYEQLGEQVFEPEDFIEAGDKVVAFVNWRGRGTTSGAETEMRQGHVFTLRDRRIARWEVFFDRAEALEAAGLSE